MKHFIAPLLAIVLLVSGCVVHAADTVLAGTVILVVDGDTIDVQLASGPIRVRLSGVDTPERGQPWGKNASAALSGLVMSKVVELKPFEQDRYDRLIADVFIEDLDINAELVKQGHGWAYRAYLTRDNMELCSVEADARKAKRGLWALPPKQRYAPWDWRKRPKRFVDYSKSTAAQCIDAARGARQTTRAGNPR